MSRGPHVPTNRYMREMGIAAQACFTAIGVLVFGCTEIFAIDDECNVDRDCRRLGEGLRCESHLCIVDEIPGAGDADGDSDVDTGSDTGTESDSEIIPNTDNESDTDAEGLEVFYRYTFAGDLEGFVGPDFIHNPDHGTAEIAHTFDSTNQTVNFEKGYGRADWSDVVDIRFTLVVDQFVSGGINLYIKSAVGWEWCSTWVDFTLVSQMTTVAIRPDACDGTVDMSVLRAIGVQLHSGGVDVGEQVVHMEIDEVRVRSRPAQ